METPGKNGDVFNWFGDVFNWLKTRNKYFKILSHTGSCTTTPDDLESTPGNLERAFAMQRFDIVNSYFGTKGLNLCHYPPSSVQWVVANKMVCNTSILSVKLVHLTLISIFWSSESFNWFIYILSTTLYRLVNFHRTVASRLCVTNLCLHSFLSLKIII